MILIIDSIMYTLQHFQFNIKTKKLSLIHKNIHEKCHDDHVTELNMNDLKINDYIDVKDHKGDWYLAKILDIKDKVYYNDNSNDINNNIKHVKSMKILIHYIILNGLQSMMIGYK